jgi:hypothetical protein
MSRIVVDKMTHDYDGELVVFLIGIRVNRPWRPDLWWPVFRAMPSMLAELSRDPESGLLGYRFLVGADGGTVVQYWSSAEKLLAYASAPENEHRPAWTAFNRRARKAPGAVGIWHETYVVDRAETVYIAMPAMGLAAATASAPLGRRGDRAAERLGYERPTVV